MAEVEIDFIGNDGGLESQVDMLDSRLNALNMDDAESKILDSLSNIESKMSKFTSTLKDVAIGVAGVFSVSQIVRFSRNVLRAADDSDEFSVRVSALGKVVQLVKLDIAEHLIPALEPSPNFSPNPLILSIKFLPKSFILSVFSSVAFLIAAGSTDKKDLFFFN